MVSTWSSGATLPSYLNNDTKYKVPDTDGCFSFVDFLPECRSPGGIFSKPDFENFRTLIDRANVWLRSNPRWRVITCESVEFKTRHDHVNYEKMTYLEHGEHSTTYVRGLRLWVGEEANYDKPQQIGYMNLVPNPKDKSGGFFSSPDFDSLDTVVSKFNQMVHTRPLPGRIITIETQEMKLKYSTEVDPDRSYWVEHGDRQTRFLFILRIFFELSAGVPEEIGIKDFVPTKVVNEGVFSLPEYEPFSYVVNNASAWSVRQQGIRICNAQSVEMKVKTGDVNTQKMDYLEHGANRRRTFYVRILRLAYTKIRDPSNASIYPSLNLSRLTCRTFVPVQLTSGFFVPEFESLRETKQRVTAWVRATGAKVISAETAALRMYTGGEARYGHEATFTYNRGEKSEYWIFIIRIYINGTPREPPKEVLPPVPEIVDDGCCTIS